MKNSKRDRVEALFAKHKRLYITSPRVAWETFESDVMSVLDGDLLGESDDGSVQFFRSGRSIKMIIDEDTLETRLSGLVRPALLGWESSLPSFWKAVREWFRRNPPKTW